MLASKVLKSGKKRQEVKNDLLSNMARGNVFKNNHVHSIYKKGKIREERINRKDIVEVSEPIIEEIR